MDSTDNKESRTGTTQSDSEEVEKSIAPPLPKYTTPPRTSSRKTKKSPFSSVESITGSFRKMKMVEDSTGEGTLENPKVIYAKKGAPETHQPFIIHCKLPMFLVFKIFFLSTTNKFVCFTMLHQILMI